MPRMATPSQTEAQQRANARYREKHRDQIQKRDRDLYQRRRSKVLAHKSKTRKERPDKAHDKELKQRYGISLADYEFMLAGQNNSCAICFRKDAGTSWHKRFCVDHNHKTGKVRGLLCVPCNQALGQLKDCPESALSAYLYLERERVADVNR